MKHLTPIRFAAVPVVVSLLLVATGGIQATLSRHGAAMVAADAAGTTTVTLAVDSRLRLDEPVLRWLPEIVAASELTRVPPSLIAGVMRVESEGNPSTVSVSGARGLMQIMPDEFADHGIPEEAWFDPATNIRTGSRIIAERTVAYGSWAEGVAHYFGIGCDAYGTCTATYVRVVFGWADYYAAILGDPFHASLGVLPADWSPPAIVPFVEQAPAAPPTAPPPPKPTSTRTPTPTPVPANTPTPSPTATPTQIPTEIPTIEPTEVPTDVPTEVPTEAPTQEPTMEPTEETPVAPTAEPTDEPATTTRDHSHDRHRPEPNATSDTSG